MSDWAEGYVSEIAYTHGFYREMAPPLLNLALTLAGVTPPRLDRPFTYFELGCGQGYTSTVLAAAMPQGRFYANDFNPAHIAFARSFAAAGGVDNVHFLEKSFAELHDLELPEFDYICLHGIYSWISTENRGHILRFLRERLKPGGVCYISYNCQPGWGAAAPLRELLNLHISRSAGPLPKRIDDAFRFATRMKELNAGYFRHNPIAGQRLEAATKLPRSYLAHEYFNRHWTLFYFPQVAEDLDQSKLTFACSANLSDHLDILNLTKEAQDFLRGIDDPGLKQTVRDFFISQQFRRDIFVRGLLPLPPSERNEHLLDTSFALVFPRDAVPTKAPFPVGEVLFAPQVYTPLLDALAAGPATLRTLLAKPALAPLGLARVMEALTLLTGQGHVYPAQPAATPTAAASLNQEIIRRSFQSDELRFLASPVVASGIATGRLDRLFLGARQAGKDPVRTAWEVFQRENQRMVANGKPLETEAENLAYLERNYQTWCSRTYVLLQQLGAA